MFEKVTQMWEDINFRRNVEEVPTNDDLTFGIPVRYLPCEDDLVMAISSQELLKFLRDNHFEQTPVHLRK